MATLRDFVPESVSVSWGGLAFSGFAQDTFISAKRNTANTTSSVGADGSVGITKNADRTGTVEITLMQNSETHFYLSAIQKRQDESRKIFRVNMSITDPSGGMLCTAKNVHIMETPEISLAGDQSEKTWTFFAEELSFIDSNPAIGDNAALAARIADAVDLIEGVSDQLTQELLA